MGAPFERVGAPELPIGPAAARAGGPLRRKAVLLADPMRCSPKVSRRQSNGVAEALELAEPAALGVSFAIASALAFGRDAVRIQRGVPGATRCPAGRRLGAAETGAGRAACCVAPAIDRAPSLSAGLADGPAVLRLVASAIEAEPHVTPRPATAPVPGAVSAAAEIGSRPPYGLPSALALARRAADDILASIERFCQRALRVHEKNCKKL